MPLFFVEPVVAGAEWVSVTNVIYVGGIAVMIAVVIGLWQSAIDALRSLKTHQVKR
ncbi:MAG: hypothetical protein V1846_05540 [Candidatus Komeilibacteria bacterium]